MATTCCLKLATLFLVLITLLHIGGFAIPAWSSVTLSAEVLIVEVEGKQTSGLWLDCACASIFGCTCFPKIYNPGWLNGVRSMETFGLIGMLLSALISIIIACSSSTGKIIRGFNIFFTAISGIFIVIGVIIFGKQNTDDFQNIFSFIESLPLDLDIHGKLSLGFYCCAIAGGACLVICVPLLVYDCVNPVPINAQYTTQGLVIFPPPSSHNQFGYMPLYAQAQTGQGMQEAPAYTVQPGYIQAAQRRQEAAAYTSQPSYIQPSQEMQGPPAYTSQPDYVQPGQVVQGTASYTSQTQPSCSQNPHHEKDVQSTSSII